MEKLQKLDTESEVEYEIRIRKENIKRTSRSLEEDNINDLFDPIDPIDPIDPAQNVLYSSDQSNHPPGSLLDQTAQESPDATEAQPASDESKEVDGSHAKPLGSSSSSRSLYSVGKRVDDRITLLSTEVSGLTSRMNGMTSRMNEMTSTMDDMKSDIADVKSDITNMKSDITNMKSRIDEISSNISNLATSINNLVFSMNAGFDQQKTRMDKLESKQEETEKENIILKKQLTSFINKETVDDSQ